MRIFDLIKNQDTYEAELGHTVFQTVQAMVQHNIGAVPVVHQGKIVGIFSERDVMSRVVAEGPPSPLWHEGNVARRVPVT